MNLVFPTKFGRPVIECPYNQAGCGAYTVPINYLWYGNSLGGGGGDNLPDIDPILNNIVNANNNANNTNNDNNPVITNTDLLTQIKKLITDNPIPSIVIAGVTVYLIAK